MISATLKSVDSVGSCNFCRRGELRQDGCGLIFPYDLVWSVRGDGTLTVNICEQCAQIFSTIIRDGV